MKKYLITVNGSKYEVEVEEITGGETVKYNVLETAKEKIPQEAAPVQKSTAASSAAASTAAAAAGNAAASPAPGKQEKEAFKSSEVPSGAQTVTAPMPGVILSVNVNNGDTIKKGGVLLILEAMKMENEIVAPRDGRIASVNVKKGDSVNVGDVLVSIS